MLTSNDKPLLKRIIPLRRVGCLLSGTEFNSFFLKSLTHEINLDAVHNAKLCSKKQTEGNNVLCYCKMKTLRLISTFAGYCKRQTPQLDAAV